MVKHNKKTSVDYQENPVGKPKKSGGFLKIVIGLLVILVVALIVLHIYSQQTLSGLVPDRSDSDYLTDRINVLVVGTDAEGNDTGRADSIMVFNVDLKNNKVNALSIPRDSRVDIPGSKNKSKINHSYAYGGIDLTKETVENLLGIPIDFYAVTNFAGFESIVDTLGGVYIDVPIRMKTHTWYGDIDLQPGYQLLDAQQALGFVRYRYDSGGDIARAGRQQQFLKAVYSQIIDPANVSKLPTVVPEILDLVDTDFTSSQIMALIDHFKSVDLETALYTETLAGHSQTISGGSYWIIDEDEMAETVQRLFFDEPTAETDDGEEAA